MAPARTGEAASLDIEALESADAAAFTVAVAPLFEGAPRFLARLAAARPFGSEEALFIAARKIAHAMPRDEQLELIDAHPRLGAPPASVSAASFREQGYDRTASTDVVAELDRLNAAYESRFGFRYCVFVAGRPREALLPGMAAALEADPEAEVRRAIDAVIDIAADRYATLGGPRDRAR